MDGDEIQVLKKLLVKYFTHRGLVKGLCIGTMHHHLPEANLKKLLNTNIIDAKK